MVLKNVLASKALGAVTVPSDLKVDGVIAVLAEKGIGAVLVIDHEARPVGILSERDIVRSQSQGGSLLGMVSIGDVVKAQLDQHQHEMGRMRTYVAGGI